MADELRRRDPARRVVFVGTRARPGDAARAARGLRARAAADPAAQRRRPRAPGERPRSRCPGRSCAPRRSSGASGRTRCSASAATRAARSCLVAALAGGAHRDPRAEREARVHEPRAAAAASAAPPAPTRRRARRSARKGVLTGNPVRGGFAALPPQGAPRALTLLVFGGSQGSRVLNQALVAALPQLPGRSGCASSTRPARPCATRSRRRYARGGPARARWCAFLDDMEARLRRRRPRGLPQRRHHLRGADRRGQGRDAGPVRARGRRPPARERAARWRPPARRVMIEEKDLSGGVAGRPIAETLATPARLSAMETRARGAGPARRGRAGRRPRWRSEQGEPVFRGSSACTSSGIGGSGMSGDRRGAAEPRLHGERLRPASARRHRAPGGARGARIVYGHARRPRGGRAGGGDVDRRARATTRRCSRRAGGACP